MGAHIRDMGNTNDDVRWGFWLLGITGIIVIVVWSVLMFSSTPDPIKETQKYVDSVNIFLAFFAAYVVVVVGLILGLAALYSMVSRSNGHRLALLGLVTGVLAGTIVLADWGALTLGTIAIADAYKDGNTGVAPALKYLEGGELPGLLDAIFMVAVVLALICAISYGISLWRSQIFPTWVIVAFGLGLILVAATIPLIAQLGGILLAVAGFSMARAIGHEPGTEEIGAARAQMA